MKLLSASTFEESKRMFQDFLVQQQISPELFWVFKEDVIIEGNAVLITEFNPDQNEKLVKELYEIGQRRNLGVSFHAFAVSDERLYCYIKLPEDPDEAGRLMLSSSHLKCSISNPLMKARMDRSTVLQGIRRIFSNRSDDIPSKPIA